MRYRFLFLCVYLAAALLPAGVLAQPTKDAPKLLGTFGGWKANSDGAGDQLTCYMTLQMHSLPNKKLKRGAAWLSITDRPGENSRNVVSYTAGYNFKPTSSVTVLIGKKSFDLFTEKDTAWSRDAATDHALAVAIRDGVKMKITGTPAAKGAGPVSDTLDLKGAAAAYQAIGKACGYPEEAPPKSVSPTKQKRRAQ
jgi:hypothetical protein